MRKLAEKVGLQNLLANVEMRILRSVIKYPDRRASAILKLPLTTYRSKVAKYGLK